MAKILPLSALVVEALAAVVAKPIGDLRDSDQVVTDVSGLVSAVTNLESIVTDIPATLSTTYRKLGDDQAYAVKSVGGFVSWSCPNHPELAQAMQGRQPEYYDYGDGMGEYYINLEVNGRYWYGWAYADLNADTVVFSVYCDYWDEETGEYYYDWAEITGKRGVAEYDLENPIDRFATKGEVSESVGSIRDGVNHLTGLLTSETKLWRTGKPNECGHGWGYMQHNLTNDLRRWRIRAPAVTPADDVRPLTVGSVVQPSEVPYKSGRRYPGDIPVILYNYQEYSYGATTPHWYTFNQPAIENYIITWEPQGNLLRFYDRYEWTLTPYNTRGVYGSDAVTHVDYRFELTGYGITWDAVQTNAIDSTKPVYRINVDLRMMDMSFFSFVTNGTSVFVKLPFDNTQTNNVRVIPHAPQDIKIRQSADALVSNTVKGVVYTAYKYFDENKNRCSITYDTIHGVSSYVVKDVYAHVFNVDEDGGLVPAHSSSSGGLHFPLYYDFEVRTPYVHTSSVVRVDTSIPPDYNEVSGVYTQKYQRVYRPISFTCPSSTTLYDTFSQAYRLMGTYDANLFYDSALDCTFRIVSSNGCFYTEVHHAGDWREKAWR